MTTGSVNKKSGSIWGKCGLSKRSEKYLHNGLVQDTMRSDFKLCFSISTRALYRSLPVRLRRFLAILAKTTDLRVSLMNKISASSTTPDPLRERVGHESGSKKD